MENLSNREIVKRFIQERWSDQKIAEVAAFNEDGKMSYANPCACLIGVDSSNNLHTDGCDANHYVRAKLESVGFWAFLKRWSSGHVLNPEITRAESAYAGIGWGLGAEREISRQYVLADILSEIMLEREVARQEVHQVDKETVNR